MCRRKVHPWGHPFIMGLHETAGAQAPMIAGLEPCELKLGPRGRQVITDIFRIGEEFGGHHRADRMASPVLGAGVAIAVAEKARDRLARTASQRLPQYIDRTVHAKPHRAVPFTLYRILGYQAQGIWQCSQP
jgi:hypothetical protein